MSTRLRLSRDYPHDVAVFATALRDPAFHRARLDAGAGGDLVVHRVTGDAVEVTVRQPVPAAHVPAALVRLLAGALVLTRSERWLLGPRRLAGEVRVDVPRAPVRAGGSMAVTALDTAVGTALDTAVDSTGAAPGCRLEVDVAVRVTVPLAGAVVEPAVVDGIRGLTVVEHDRISAWLDGLDRSPADPGPA